MTYVNEFLIYGNDKIYDTKKYGKSEYIRNLPSMTYKELFYNYYVKMIKTEMKKHGIKGISIKTIINDECDIYDFGVAETHFFTYL